MEYKKRLLEKQLDLLLEVFPIISVTGPRQSGKSTMLENYAGNKWQYFNLDNRTVRLRVSQDPDLFVRDFQSNVIIDEAQKVPDLFHSIKEIIDKGYSYKIILSGSANFLLMQSITESLAGRVGILELHPYSIAESLNIKPTGYIHDFLDSKSIEALFKKLSAKKHIDENKLLDFILEGGFPKIHNLKSSNAKLQWFQNYITTYIEKDLRDIGNITDLESFQIVYNLLAYQAGKLLNISNIASDIGLTLNTIKKYISILETSYQYKKLFPFKLGYKEKITKSPKVYGFDSGMINYLIKNFDRDRMLNSGYWGAILENWLFIELYKVIKDLVPRPQLHFYRTRNDAEVDFVIEHGKKLIPIEVKTSCYIKPIDLRGLKSFMNSYSKFEIPYGLVIHRGEKVSWLDDKILGIPLTIIY